MKSRAFAFYDMLPKGHRFERAPQYGEIIVRVADQGLPPRGRPLSVQYVGNVSGPSCTDVASLLLSSNIPIGEMFYFTAN